MSYETFEHTADIGLRIRAKNLSELFSEASIGLFSLLLQGTDRVEERTSRKLELAADLPEDLLHDWLSELLFLFETEHLVFRRFDVQASDSSVRGTCFGELLEEERHHPEMEIKAVTYHGLNIQQVGDQYESSVIFDI
jgi:SHS2 domain-containing protein